MTYIFIMFIWVNNAAVPTWAYFDSAISSDSRGAQFGAACAAPVANNVTMMPCAR